jgi:hypothetical protein
MKKINTLLLSTLLCATLSAKEEEEHEHEGSNNIKINVETLDFDNSKTKKDGERYGIELDHEDEQQHIQFYYEKSHTNTKETVEKDLEVKKYTLKYQYKLRQKEHLSLSFIQIDDNLMEETDGGHIYGLGYSRNGVGLTQYLSDYPHFNVYQSDLKYSFKKQGIKTTLIGKYIHLNNKNSNDFSRKAKNDYFTAGVKLHTHYNGFHLGAGMYLGKRIFAVMKDGFKVQHHAMEFKESYTIGIGHALSDKMTAHLRYGYHKAKEIISNNDDVTVNNLALDFLYTF